MGAKLLLLDYPAQSYSQRTLSYVIIPGYYYFRQVSTHQKHTTYNSFQFVTFTCYKWLPLFDMVHIYDYLKHWVLKLNEKGCVLCGYVIMPNHLHMLLYVNSNCRDLNLTIGEGKRFLAYEIVKRLKKGNHSGILIELERGVQKKERIKGKKHQVFRLSFDAKEVAGEDGLNKILDYMHANPVSRKWNLANDYSLYEYSSAGFYIHGFDSYLPMTDYRMVN